MSPKMIALALAGSLMVGSVGCQRDSSGSGDEPGSSSAKQEPGSPPDKGGSGAQGEKGSTQREPGS